MSTASSEPLSAAEAALLFEQAFGRQLHVVLAVSGGADSTALMFLAAAWRQHRSNTLPSLSVVTVDHGLRAESALEAASVAAAARALGLDHTTLRWEGAKPATGVQAAARRVRYDLIATHLASNGWAALATAHTLDDQAETLLLRLARGSGVDGLAAMRRETAMGGMLVLRPLLGVSKQRLVATLSARGIGWIEDPSNHRVEFERVRLRQARATFDALGLTSDQIALSARRLMRVRDALDQIAEREVARLPDQVVVSPLGFARLQWGWVAALPAEIALRVLARLMALVGGRRDAVSLGQLEAMTLARAWQSPTGITLAGVQFIGDEDGGVILARETGRSGLPVLILGPGECRIWDNRFEVAVADASAGTVQVAALGEASVRGLEIEARAGVPACVLATLPCFRRNGEVVAVPDLGVFTPPAPQGSVTSRFRNWPIPVLGEGGKDRASPTKE